VHSESFLRNVGEINYDQTFSKDHKLATIITDPIHNILNLYECEIYLGEDRKELRTEVWKNPYNIFALFQPVIKPT
jgi:hypothetical protein